MRKLFLLIFFQSAIWSLQNDPYELAAFGGEPSSIIGGCVSAISGDYFFSEDVLVVKGYEPIHLQNRYISRKGDLPLGGWNFWGNHIVAQLHVMMSPMGKAYHLELPDRSGVKLVYSDNLMSSSKKERFRFNLIGAPGGLTNCSRGQIGARLNLKNNRVYRDSHDLKQIIVDSADGSKRCYRCKESLKFEEPLKGLKLDQKTVPFYLSWEILPNGNRIKYKYVQIHGTWLLESITTKSSDGKQVFAWVRFEYNYPDREHLFWIKSITSDNQVLEYSLDPHQKNNGTRFWLLKNVLSPSKPNESYHYLKGKKSGIFLCEKTLPDGRREKIDYNIKNPEDSNYKSVTALQRPLGEGANLRDAFQIHYAPGKYNKKGGHTNAFDAEGNLTQYHYDKNFMLTSLKRFSGSDNLFSEELFHWHDVSSSKGNWIQGKTLLNDLGQPLFAYLYHYDDKGNVVQEDFWGDLTGQERKLIRNGNHLPHTQEGECYFVKRAFHSNNLLFREVWPNGLMEEYHYHGGTDLLYAKFSYEGNCIKKRQFFLYEGSILVEEIIDDGSTQDIHNVQEVTQRLIKKITPRRHQPFYGFPKEIEEKYYDLNSRQEILLRKQVIDYDSKGLVSQITHYDRKGRKRYDLTYSYDGKGRLISQTDPLKRVRTIQHDQNNNPLVEDDPNEAFAFHHRFDFSNRPIESIKIANTGEQKKIQNRFNLLNQKKEEIDEQGNITRYEYDPFGHVTKVTLPPVFDEKGNEKIPVIQKEYNALGQVSLEIDAEENKREYFYTSRGKPYRIIHPDGTEERMTYTLEGEVKKHISPEGVETHFTYDYQNRITSKKIIKGNVLSEEKYVYNTFHLIEKIAPDNVSTHFSYDGAGRKTKEKVEGRITLFSYDSLGRLVKVKQVIDNENAQVILKKYDLLDRVIQELELDDKGNLFGFTHYTYDEYSNNAVVKKEVHVGNAFHFFEYDCFRRLIKEVNPVGDETTITYNDHFKDKNSQTVIQKIAVDPKGHQTVETFNNHGAISTLENLNKEGKLLLRESFYYNLNGKKIRQVSKLFDPDKIIIKTWKYDSLGRVIELNESNEKITLYHYSPDGHLIKLIKPDGVVISYGYDGLGRQTSTQTSDGTCHYSLEYDKMGNVTQSVDHLTDRMTKRTYNHFGDLLHETLGNKIYLKRAYDSLSRCVELQFPDESKVLYLYDPYHLISVKRFDSFGVECYEHTYDQYDHSHNLISEFHPGSLGPAFHQIDLMSRRIQTDAIYSTEKIVEIDPNGNVLKYHRHFNDEDEITEYQYDDLDQLTNETGRFAHQYTYDSHYNRIQKDDANYAIDTLHQLQSTSDTSYEHDPNGNRIATLKDTHEVHYSYDGLDRLTQIHSGNKAVNYSYDSWGRCLSRTYLSLQEGEWSPTYTEDFLYDNQNELGNYPHKIRILGQGRGAEIGAAIAIETADNFYVPFHDLYGNVIAIMNWDGESIESYRFSAFGEEEIFNNDVEMARSVMNPWRFQSKRKMGGLVNFGRRFYDPETGRWLSPDPKGFSEGPNLYQYLLNAPQLHFDLYGEAVQKLREIEQMEKQLTFDLDFEKRAGGSKSRNWAYYPDRDYSQVADHPLITGKKEIGFIGGINNSFDEHKSNVKLLSKYAGDLPIHSTYNATHGMVDDIREARMGLNLIATTPAVLSYERKLNFFGKAPDDSVYFQVAHSQGMIHEVTSQLMMPKEYRDRTVYLGIAPAAYMPRGLCKNAFHYESIRDVVPYLQKAIGLIGNTANNISILKPHPEAAFFDHSFSSPTFKPQIINKIENYIDEKYDY
ncbi:MAG: RHS repeat protein [Simkaniaceae bacterium]|nr:MAG: RHS repeat protein [Simkaniaceae bacterium]